MFMLNLPVMIHGDARAYESCVCAKIKGRMSTQRPIQAGLHASLQS